MNKSSGFVLIGLISLLSAIEVIPVNAQSQRPKIGLVLSKDGKEIPTGRILARKVDSDNFQDATAFLNNGGQKGRQSAFITTGSYRINTFLFEIVIADQIKIFENDRFQSSRIDKINIVKF